MTSYIERKPGYVIQNREKIICIVASFNTTLLPFVLMEKDVVRSVPYKRTKIKKADYIQLLRQVYAIFGRNRERLGLNKEIPHSLYINRRDKSETERLQILKKFRTRVLSDGSISIVRIEAIDNRRIKKSYIYNDIDTAIRSQGHILERYIDKDDCELSLITEIETNIIETSNVLLNWHGINNSSIKKIEANIEKITAILKRSRNIFKKIALAQLEKIPGMKDALGRINPSALSARSAKAGESMEQRTQQIHGLAVYALSLQMVLKNEKFEMEKNLLSAKCLLKALLNSSDKTWSKKEFMLKKLGLAIFFLQSIWANPFLSSASNAICLLMEARRNINAGQLQLARVDTLAALAFIT